MNDSLTPTPPEDSADKTLKLLEKILPGVVKKFTPGRPEYSGTTEYKKYFDYWFEMPGLTDQYASVGFLKENGSLYWCAPKPAQEKLHHYINAGYYPWGDKKNLYKDLMLPPDFLCRSISEQESWFVGYITEQIQEYDRLNQMK